MLILFRAIVIAGIMMPFLSWSQVMDDIAATDEDQQVMLSVTDNDSSPDGIDVSTVDLDPGTGGRQTTASAPGGSFSVDNLGNVTFIPEDDFFGSAEIFYSVLDLLGNDAGTASITVNINSVNDAPIAVDDVTSTDALVPVSFPVTSNDNDIDGTIDHSSVDLNLLLDGVQNFMLTLQGTFSADASGNITYMPALLFSGVASITYVVLDNEGLASNPATFSITVSNADLPPVAADDVASTNEDESVVIEVLSNDTDDHGLATNSVDFDPVTGGIQSSANTSQGTFVANAAGEVTFTPVADYFGLATVSYTVNDNAGQTSNPATITVTVNSVNVAPVAVDDAASTDENVPVLINVLSNDSDPDGSLDPSNVDLDVTTPGIQNTNTVAGGTYTVDGSGQVNFTPLAGFTGSSSVSYTVRDNMSATSNVATITVTVNGVNAAPTANDDTAITNEDEAASFNILTNDTDDVGIQGNTVDLDPLQNGRQTSVSNAAGTFSVNNSGLLTFTPALNYHGSTSVQYTVEDADGLVSNIATITINVADVNDLPVAVADSPSTNEDTPVNISILANDSDVDGTLNPATVDLDPSTGGVQSSITVEGGTYSVNASGVVTFTPTPNYHGSSSIQYNVRDDDGGLSNTVSITVTIASVNDNPVAVNDAASTDEGAPVTFNVVANDTDDGSVNAATVDLDPSSPGIQSTFTHASGTFVVNSTGDVTFTPALNFNGTVVINYTVNDNIGATSNIATITVSVSGVNAPPVAVNDAASTDEDVPVSFNILTNDTDDLALAPATVDLDPSTPGRQTTMSSTGGTFSVNNAGLVTFTPAANFNGSTSIQYTVSDTEGSVSNVATITVNVADINDLPVAVADAATTSEDTPVPIMILANDSDVDGTINPASVDLDVSTAGIQNTITIAGGTYTVSAAGVVTFTPAVNFNGVASIQYNVRDDDGGVSNNATITITVSGSNDAPVAVNDAATTNEDTPVTISILSNDNDIDGTINASSVDLDVSAAGIQTTATVTGGAFTVNAAGVVTFTPTANYHGTASVQYNVRDDLGAVSNNATITVTINSVNDPPVAVNDVASTDQGDPVTINVLANDTDDGTINAASVDLDPSTPGIQSTFSHAAGTFSVSAAGVVTYTPAANFSGSVSISYTVNDNEGATSNVATITVTVSNVNSPPVAVNDVVNSNEDQVASINVLLNDTDDGGLNAATVDVDPGTPGRQTTATTSGGSFSVNNSGLVTFSPTLNFNGTTSIQYTVEDNEGLVSNTATVTFNVADVNDPPVAVADATTTNEDTPVSINLIGNDTDVDGTINASSVDLDVTTAGIQASVTTTAGSWAVSAAGLLTFTQALNFNGVASIQYNVRDDDGAVSNNATITVTVNAVNDPPLAVNDAASTNENQAVSINVLSNDTDDNGINPASVDLDPSTSGIQSSISVAAGSFSVSSSGVVTFSPVANFNGAAVASYTVNDIGGLTSNVATITITVASVNSAPVATNDAVSTNEDTSVAFDVTGNDVDDVGVNKASVDLNTAVAGQQTTRNTPQGNYTVDANGIVTFTPALNFNGTSSITYTIMDHEGATSNAATITVTVNPGNDKPVALNDSRTTNEDTPVTISVLSNDSDVDGTIVPSSVDLNPAVAGIQNSLVTDEGTYTVNASGVVTFTPANNFFGTSVITYVISDDEGLVSDPATITVTVTPANDPPIANNDIASTDQNVQVSFNVTTNDIDVDGTVNVATVDLNPGTGGIQNTRIVPGGTYSVDATGLVTFVPMLNFSGTSSITYTVNDNAGATSNAATISVLVNFVNQKPVAVNDVATTNEDTPVTINVLSNDTDDGSLIATTVDLNVVLSGIQTSFSTSEGTYTVNNTGVVTFTPALNFTGTSSISYTVNDNIGETSNVATITVIVNGVNDPPVATNDVVSTNEDTPVIIKVILNDADIDGTIDPTTVDLIPATEEIDRTRTVPQGTFTVNATNGDVTFTPAANINGTATGSYNVRDNNGAKSNTATITVNILNVNDPPSFNVIADQRVLKNSAEKSFTITGISPGPMETEQLVINATSQNTTLIPHPVITYNGTSTTATLTFKPQLNQSGTAEVVVKALDGGLNEFTRSFIVTVVDVSITSVPVTIAFPDELYEYNITTTDIPETLTLATTQKPAWLTLTSTGKNTARLSGTPPANAVSSVVTIQLRDGASVVDQQQFTIDVNRRPTASPFVLTGEEDVVLPIGSSPFLLAYSDPDNHALTEVQITQLPRHGSLSLGNVAVTLNQFISLSELGALLYTPSANYFGLDTAYYKVKDSFSYSTDPSYFHFVLSAVNDPPIIEGIEAEPLVHDIGREQAQIFTSQFRAIEPEGDLIVSAVIGFRAPNFNSRHDLLEFVNTPSIKGSYDDISGILTLTGSASVEEYAQAIRSITYTFIDLNDIILQSRFVYVTLSDATSTSAPVEREIKLIYDFVELDIPNVFTPDGNGQNDLWKITATTGLQQYNDATIRVFDSRGKLVFETVGFDTPWDGSRAGGNQVQEGTYFYVVDLNYGKVKYTGSVTVLRAKL